MARTVCVVDVSSSDESDDDVPEAAECQERIDHFVAVTGGDQALAQMYLQQNGWETERALNAYFQKNGGDPRKPSRSSWISAAVSRTRNGSAEPTFQVRPITQPIEVSSSSEASNPPDDSVEIVQVPDSDGDDSDDDANVAPPSKRMRSSSYSKDDNDVLEIPVVSSSAKTPALPAAPIDDDEKTWERLRFLSWNIDGLDEKNVKARAACVAKHILDLSIDVAFLQEVTPENFAVLKAELDEKYLVIPARPPMLNLVDTRDYFTSVCIRKCGKIEFKENLWRPFPGSIMMRGLQIVKLVVKKRGSFPEFPMVVVNAHLESTKDHATERKVQLKKSFTVVEDLCKSNSVCVFSGDMNARDGEIVEVGGLPKIARDMWEACGAKEYLRYTWDARRNTNCGFHNPKTGPRMRFDRAYFAQQDRVIEPDHFGFMGLLKVPNHQCFPSDHWALYYVLKRLPGNQ